jgi:hypothetical protein
MVRASAQRALARFNAQSPGKKLLAYARGTVDWLWSRFGRD